MGSLKHRTQYWPPHHGCKGGAGTTNLLAFSLHNCISFIIQSYSVFWVYTTEDWLHSFVFLRVPVVWWIEGPMHWLTYLCSRKRYATWPRMMTTSQLALWRWSIPDSRLIHPSSCHLPVFISGPYPGLLSSQLSPCRDYGLESIASVCANPSADNGYINKIRPRCVILFHFPTYFHISYCYISSQQS